MTATTRIRWEPTAGGAAYGYVGTRATAVFKIWQYDEGGSAVQPWALKSDWLAGYSTGTHPDDLKAEAERWLEEYVASLGAVFRDEPAATSEDSGTCPALACSHLWSLHGPGGCTGKVFPAHSLTGEPCPCEHGARL